MPPCSVSLPLAGARAAMDDTFTPAKRVRAASACHLGSALKRQHVDGMRRDVLVVVPDPAGNAGGIGGVFVAPT